MIILQAKDLCKYFGAENIFAKVSFVIKQGEKVGLIGPNGAGKTTLFKCLTGEEILDSGDIISGEKLALGYLQQMPHYPTGTSLFDILIDSFTDVLDLREKMAQLEKDMGIVKEAELTKIMNQYARVTQEYEQAGGFSCEALIRRITSGLGFSEPELGRDINSFSGGEKTRASLAKLLVREPDLLLLDEPTNHLDLQTIEWLESYLKNYHGSVLLISHDRYFLDKVTTKTLELEFGTIHTFGGNYSRYLDLKEEKLIAQQRAYEKQQKHIEATEEYISKYRAGIKSKQARGRQSQLNRLERIDSPLDSVAINLNSLDPNVSRTGNQVLKVTDLSFGYDGIELLKDIDFEINFGDKVALIGSNGTGKTTLLKLITGELQALEGNIDVGSRVKVGYYDQHHSDLDANKRVVDELMHNFVLTETEARCYLGAILFQGDDVFKLVKDLSGGEKGRLSFLKLLLTKPNFLILDEPTNHLDISSKEIIEDFLWEYTGTILMVSHDRYFLDKVANRTIELAEGRLINYLGNYSYYKEKKECLTTERLIKQEAREKKNEKNTNFEKQPKINKAKTREKISFIEKTIEAMELRLQELGELLADASSYQDEESAKELIKEYKTLEEIIPATYEEWETLNDALSNA